MASSSTSSVCVRGCVAGATSTFMRRLPHNGRATVKCRHLAHCYFALCCRRPPPRPHASPSTHPNCHRGPYQLAPTNSHGRPSSPQALALSLGYTLISCNISCPQSCLLLQFTMPMMPPTVLHMLSANLKP